MQQSQSYYEAYSLLCTSSTSMVCMRALYGTSAFSNTEQEATVQQVVSKLTISYLRLYADNIHDHYSAHNELITSV